MTLPFLFQLWLQQQQQQLLLCTALSIPIPIFFFPFLYLSVGREYHSCRTPGKVMCQLFLYTPLPHTARFNDKTRCKKAGIKRERERMRAHQGVEQESKGGAVQRESARERARASHAHESNLHPTSVRRERAGAPSPPAPAWVKNDKISSAVTPWLLDAKHNVKAEWPTGRQNQRKKDRSWGTAHSLSFPLR